VKHRFEVHLIILEVSEKKDRKKSKKTLKMTAVV
jgi:hypothetical protein